MLYERTAQLAKAIDRADYVRLFEETWRDCTSAAGWSIDFDYETPSRVALRLSRSAP